MTWKALRHPNVLPLVGVTMADSRFGMVSEWMMNGNINEFVRTHDDADRLGLVRIFLPFRPSLPSVADNCITHLAGRRCQGIDLHARARNDPW